MCRQRRTISCQLDRSNSDFGIDKNPQWSVKMDIPQEFRFLYGSMALQVIVVEIVFTFPFHCEIADSKRSDVLEEMGTL